MLNILRIISGLAAFLLIAYYTITLDDRYMIYMQSFAAIMFSILAIAEFKESDKKTAVLYTILAALFLFKAVS